MLGVLAWPCRQTPARRLPAPRLRFLHPSPLERLRCCRRQHRGTCATESFNTQKRYFVRGGAVLCTRTVTRPPRRKHACNRGYTRRVLVDKASARALHHNYFVADPLEERIPHAPPRHVALHPTAAEVNPVFGALPFA